jgi:NAD(P)-dependent dehydrogenase (short-subunit alcohol dehydrogenase family)
MQMTSQQKRAVTLGAVGLGALYIAQQAWRRRDAFDFAGKSVVITGGSRGLGLVVARQLARQGARLTLMARDEAELARAAAALLEEYPDAPILPAAADIRQRTEVTRAIARAVEHHGGIDVLINNAGTIQVGPLDHMKLSDYDDAMQTHFWGPLYTVLASLPHMRATGGGRIVNISSIGGRISVPHLLPYSASKFALAGFSEGLRTELARDNIVVTTVYPGLMRTGSPVNALFKGQRPQEYAWFAISDSLPLTSINVERAASQIINACRYGDAELVITLQAKAAIVARTIAPELFAEAMTMINRLLPDPAMKDGDESRRGREAETDAAGPTSLLTRTTYDAAARNNEL